MKTIMLFVKVHNWIGYSIDFNHSNIMKNVQCIQGFQNVLKQVPTLVKQAAVTIEIVCHELIVMTSVAGDIQLSSRQNSGRRLVYLLIINTVID